MGQHSIGRIQDRFIVFNQKDGFTSRRYFFFFGGYFIFKDIFGFRDRKINAEAGPCSRFTIAFDVTVMVFNNTVNHR